MFEELFFRGLLRQSFAGRIGVWAVWAQAVLFGLAHYQFGLGPGNVSVVVVTAGIGVVLGYTAHVTHRLAPGIIAHGIFNLFVTLTIIGVWSSCLELAIEDLEKHPMPARLLLCTDGAIGTRPDVRPSPQALSACR